MKGLTDDRLDTRHSLLDAPTAQESGVRDSSRADPGTWHRSDDRHVQLGGPHSFSESPLSTRYRTGLAGCYGADHRWRVFVCRKLSRLAAPPDGICRVHLVNRSE